MLEKFLEWLFSTSSWVPALIAIITTFVLVMISLKEKGERKEAHKKKNDRENNEFETVTRRIYKDGETVRIDGKKFVECEFQDCVIEYNGGPYRIERSKMPHQTGNSKIKILSLNPAVQGAIELFHATNAFTPGSIYRIPKDE